MQKTKQEPIAEKIPDGWKEYVDEEYKFRIWYPEEFTAYGETAEVIAYKFFDDKDNVQIVDFSMPLTSDAPVFLLYTYIYKSDFSITSFIKNNTKNLTEEDINNLEKYTSVQKINNIDFYRVAIPDRSVKYYVKKDENIFVFKSQDATELTEELKSTFDQMVRSFKFIE